MTKQRPSHWICNNPDCPHEKAKRFNDWIRNYLPDSRTGFIATDIDFCLYNFTTKKMIFVEIKTMGRELKQWQKILFQNIEKWINRGIDSSWKFYGFHLIEFQNTSPEDGEIYWDGNIVTKTELIKNLSLTGDD